VSERQQKSPEGDDEAKVWEELDRNDELDDAVIAADDTGMLGGERQITIATTEEELGKAGPP
jgi:hypothetical protein